jgi:hypothetical protein
MLHYLHSNYPIVDHDLFGKEIGTDGRFVLIGELLVDILVHEGSLSDARVAQDDHLQEHFLARCHCSYLLVPAN